MFIAGYGIVHNKGSISIRVGHSSSAGSFCHDIAMIDCLYEFAQ